MLEQTLYGLLSHIERDEIVLPAMQRPFVWKEDRIYRLIDSLLRGFPIRAVMLWRTSTAQRFRRLPRDVDTEIAEVFNYETSTDTSNRYLVLDGQQRLVSLFAAFKGTYNHRRLYIDVLSGDPEDKDPGNEYYDCQFLSEPNAIKLNSNNTAPRQHFMAIQELIKINPIFAAKAADKKAKELNLNGKEAERINDVYIRCANTLGSHKSLQAITVDEDPSQVTPIEEILEIFVRVNSGGLVLQKSDLLMSLLDLTWNNIQPELQKVVRDINASRPYEFTRDDILKSLLLADGAETRFDKLVSDRKQVERLAERLPVYIEQIRKSWQLLGCLLLDDCKIHSERFFRGGHNALLPFVLFFSKHDQLSNTERRKIVMGIYLAIMSGVFSGAEARMGAFARNKVAQAESFPLGELIALVKREYGIKSLDDLLRRHLDLALNIAHGGITIDGNPDDLQRDHIFPKSLLEKSGYPYEVINHYANFHFLRGTDNLNKLDKPPDEWFVNPGKNVPAYSDKDLEVRLLTWDDLQPGSFDLMIERRGKRMREKAEQLFGLSEEEFNALFADKPPKESETSESIHGGGKDTAGTWEEPSKPRVLADGHISAEAIGKGSSKTSVPRPPFEQYIKQLGGEDRMPGKALVMLRDQVLATHGQVVENNETLSLRFYGLPGVLAYDNDDWQLSIRFWSESPLGPKKIPDVRSLFLKHFPDHGDLMQEETPTGFLFKPITSDSNIKDIKRLATRISDLFEELHRLKARGQSQSFADDAA